MSYCNHSSVRNIKVVLILAIVFSTGLTSRDGFIPYSAVLYFHSCLVVEPILLLEFLISYF
jgi:hypothetical protein